MATPAGIEIAGLSKSYGPIEAVRDVDVTDRRRARPSRCSGPNGAGKSTTIDMLLGLPEPDAGTVVRCSAGTPSDAVDAGRGRRDAADRRAPPRPHACASSSR